MFDLESKLGQPDFVGAWQSTSMIRSGNYRGTCKLIGANNTYDFYLKANSEIPRHSSKLPVGEY